MRTVSSSSTIPCSRQYVHGKSQSRPDPPQTGQGEKTGTPSGATPPLAASAGERRTSTVKPSKRSPLGTLMPVKFLSNRANTASKEGWIV